MVLALGARRGVYDCSLSRSFYSGSSMLTVLSWTDPAPPFNYAHFGLEELRCLKDLPAKLIAGRIPL